MNEFHNNNDKKKPMMTKENIKMKNVKRHKTQIIFKGSSNEKNAFQKI